MSEASAFPTETQPGPGRPRGFDRDAAIDAGIALIRRDGYEASSLEALTGAMGIARSSFYASFGSKRGVLLAALERYSGQRLAALAALAGSRGTEAALVALAGIDGDPHGCLLVNCVTELCPRDAEVAALGARHMARVAEIIEAGLDGPDSARRAQALLAVALGAQTLRKGGAPPEAVADIVALATTTFAFHDGAGSQTASHQPRT